MQAYGGLPTWVAALIALLLALYQGLFPAFFGWLVARTVARRGMAGVWLASPFWVATEWLRGSVGVGDGFPWVSLGSSQSSVIPIVQLASVAGLYGLSALLALVSSAAAALALSRQRAHVRGAIAVATIVIVVAVCGMVRFTWGTLATDGPALRVGLVQGNVRQENKYDARYRDAIINSYLTLSRQTIGAGAGLVVWPEASTPFFFDLDPVLSAPIRTLALQSRTPFIIGTDELERGQGGAPNRIYNTAVVLGADGQSHGTYRKIRIVPFGEYVPAKKMLFFVGPLVEAVSDFTAGTEPIVLDAGGARVSVSICYESIYPWLSRAFVQRGSQLLATITNDAWFGTSSAAYQHFDQGALRAVEEGRYMVRAANTGISGAVDPYGRVLARTRLFEATALTVDVRLLDRRTLYSYAGDVVVWLALVLCAWGLVPPKRPQPGATADRGRHVAP